MALNSPAPSSLPPASRREIWSWAMFDFANSSYTTIIVTVAFSVYFTTIVAPAASAYESVPAKFIPGA